MRNRYSQGTALSVLMLACSTAQAFEYKLITGFSTDRSNNIGRVSEESGLVQKDWVHKPMLRGLLNHETSDLRISADYLVEHRIYAEGVFDDRTRWTGRADLRWDAISELLQFNVTNSRTEATEDALIQNVETNRQVTSSTSAGPKLLFRPRSSDQLSLEYRYSDINQGLVGGGNGLQPQFNADSERQLFAVAYQVGLTENRSLTAEVSRDKVEFEQNAPDLEIDTASLLYSSKGDTLEFDARAGYTTIDRSLNRAKVDGVIGRLNLKWRLSGNGEFQVQASRNINDQSDDVLRGNAGFGQGAVFANTDVNEVFEEDVLRLTYTHRWGRNTARLGYNLLKQDFDDSAFAPNQSRDQEDSGFSAYYERRLTPTVRARFNATFVERQFDRRGVDEDYITADFRIDWQAGRALTIFAGTNYEKRDPDGVSPQVNQFAFDEFVYSFGFNFDLVNRYQLQQKR